MLVSAMRLRASSSSKSAACADARGEKRTPPATPRRRPEHVSRSLAGVDDVDAAVLGPRRFVMAGVLRLFLAEAHRLDCISCAPSSSIMRLTASERFWPSAMLYSREPRSSVWPWMRHLRGAVLLQDTCACASTSGLNSSRTTKLS